MTARVLDGKRVAASVLDGVRARVEQCRTHGVHATLAVVLVGEDPASAIYVRNKGKRAAEVGIRTLDEHLPASTTTEALLELVERLNRTPDVDGILVQLPLPAGVETERVLLAIDPAKDVDGFHPDNLGRLMKGRTSLVIAHRLSTIRDADTIVVLEQGRIAETGSHDELMARRGLYFYLASQQSGLS